MRNINIYWIIAGVINLFTTILHVISGQLTLINPLLSTKLKGSVKTELLGAWHMVTAILIVTSCILLYAGFKRQENLNKGLLKLISCLYLLFAVAFILVSLFQGIFTAQWILFLPIGILGLIGIQKSKS